MGLILTAMENSAEELVWGERGAAEFWRLVRAPLRLPGVMLSSQLVLGA